MKITINIPSLFRPMRSKRSESTRHPVLFVEQSLRLATRLSGSLSRSTMRNYVTALHSFSAFLKDEDVPVSAITPHLVRCYADWLASNGVGANTTSCYLRSLRALYNRLVRGRRKRMDCPFSGLFTGNVPTEKRAVSISDMRKLCTLHLPENSRQQLHLDLFLFCFYAMGMPFADAVRLRWTQVHEDYFEYRRKKTGRSVRIGIEPCMRDIMHRYYRQGNIYVFPILPSKTDGAALSRAYRSALGRYNRALKRIALLAGVRSNLSSYVPRHTWATQAYSHKVEMALIAQALGHATTRTTWSYVKQIRNGALVMANRKIIKEINANTHPEELHTTC